MGSKVAAKVGVPIKDRLTVLDSARQPVTGLVKGVGADDLKVELWNHAGVDVEGSITVTITEVANGDYRTDFTGDAEGLWTLIVRHDTHFPWGHRQDYQLYAQDIDDLPSAAEIDTQLSGTHGGGSWEPVGLGDGANVVDVTVEDDVSSLPIPSVQVQVRNSDETVLLAAGVTDVNGVVGFLLDDGTYKVRLRKLGSYTFSNPETLVVVGATQQTYQGTAFSPSAPPTPETCVVSGYTHDTGDLPISVDVVADLVEPRKFTSGGVQIIKGAKTVSSALADGYWEVTLTRSGEFTAENVKYSFKINGIAMGEYTIPDQDNVEFASLPENTP
jgi:hypothetical protein